MTQEEMKAALSEELKTFKNSMGEYATKEDLENKLQSLEQKFNDLDNKEALSELKEAIEKQGLELQKINTKKQSEKTLEELLTEQSATMKAIANGEDKRVVIKTDVTRASVTDHTLAMRLADVGQLATQNNVLEPLFAQATVSANSNGVIRYVDQAARTNNADWKAEGTQLPESAITWVEKTLSIQKIGDTIPVTKEALNDVNFIASEVRNLLLVNHGIKVDNSLWNANGTAPNIKGIYTYASAYTAAASGITDANVFDLIAKLRESIASGTKYQPNYVIMNIADINKMKLKKDANNNYIVPPFATEGGQVVDGVRIVESNSVTANTLLIGDFRFATLYKLGGVEIEMGYIDKQFVEDMVTLKATQRMALLVRSAHEDAFLKVTDIDADLVTLAS